MALSFPSNPTNGQIYSALGRGWKYDSTTGAWEALVRVNTAFDTDDITEGPTNQFITDERVDDRVGSLLQQGTNITLNYDDAANTLTINSTNNLASITTNMVPDTNNAYDIGTTLLKWKDAYFAGTINTANVISDNITVNTDILPDAGDGATLGSATKEWSDLYLADESLVYFGDDQDVTLTHVQDTGLLLNSSMQLQFGDSGTYINQSADGILNISGDGEVEINSPTLDLNANIEGDLIPSAGDTYHIGSSTAKWKDLHLNGNAIIDGNLTVNGSTTTINSTTLDVDDLNITIASGAANSAAADGAGITVDGAAATLTYVDATSSWNFNKNLHVLADTDADMHLGRASIGSPITDVAYFAHTDHFTSTNFGLAQTSVGLTAINAASGQNINFNNNNNVVMQVYGGNVNSYQDHYFINTDADQYVDPELYLVRRSPSPAQWDFLGSINSLGYDSNANTDVYYGSINSRIANVTNGAHEGVWNFYVADSGTNTWNLSMYKDKLQFGNEQTLEWYQHKGTTNTCILDWATPSQSNTITLPDESGTVLTSATTLNLSGLDDVNLTNIADEDVIKYDSATSKFINTTIQDLTAGQVFVDEFTATGSTNQFTLSQDPGSSNAVQVFVDGVPQLVSNYTVVGTTLTLGGTPTNGQIVEVRGYGIYLSIGTVADNSITGAKLQDNTISGAKIIDGTIGLAEMVTGIYTDQTFTGNNGTTFTLQSDPVNAQALLVVVDNVIQEPVQNFNVAGTTLTFTSAPPNGARIYCRFLGLPLSSVSVPDGSVNNAKLALTYTSNQYTGDNTTTDFTIEDGHTDHDVLVILDGLILPPSDYSIVNTTLTFSTAPALNQSIDIRYMPV